MAPSSDIVVIVSTPRSGSSWLARVLRAHPRLKVFTHNTQDNHLLYLLRPLKSLSPFGDDHTDVGSRLDRLFWRTRLRLLKTFFRTTSPDSKLLIATPTAGAFLPLIVDGFPGAKFVHLRRDTLDRVASFRKYMATSAEKTSRQRYKSARHRGRAFAARQVLAHWFHLLRWLRCRHAGYLGPRPGGFREAARLPLTNFLCWYCAQYDKGINEALARVPEERKLVCVYEDLASNYEREITRLMDFIGVETPKEFLEKTSAGIVTNGIGGHKRHFDEREIDDLRGLLADYGESPRLQSA